MPEKIKAIEAARKAAGLTQGEMARRLCVTARTYRRWLAGEKQVPNGIFEKIEEFKNGT